MKPTREDATRSTAGTYPRRWRLLAAGAIVALVSFGAGGLTVGLMARSATLGAISSMRASTEGLLEEILDEVRATRVFWDSVGAEARAARDTVGG